MAGHIVVLGYFLVYSAFRKKQQGAQVKVLTPRQRIILEALLNCGESGTTQEIAKKAGLNANGVSQSLGVLRSFVTEERQGKVSRWRLRSRELPVLSRTLWSRFNSRLQELSEKQQSERLTVDEITELSDLRSTRDRHLARVAPLSTDRAEAALSELRSYPK